MPVTGQPIFNGLVIAKIDVDFTNHQLSMKAIAAFINTETGMTHGSTTASGSEWSQATITLLAELRTAMETDLAKKHFYLDAPTSNKLGLQPTSGLAEHLAEEAPSV